MPAERLCSSQPMPDSKVTSHCSNGQGPIFMQTSSALLNYTLRGHLTCGVWLELRPSEQKSENIVDMNDYISSNIKAQNHRAEFIIVHAFSLESQKVVVTASFYVRSFLQCGHGSDKET